MKNITILAGFVLLCSPTLRADSEKPAASSKTEAGYHCLFIGHSFFIPVARKFENLPARCGGDDGAIDFIITPRPGNYSCCSTGTTE